MDDLIQISENSQTARELNNQLTSGERIIWAAQPSGKRMKSLLGAWIFAIPWTLFSVFFIFKWYEGTQGFSTRSITDLLPLIIPILFVFIGLVMIAAPILAISAAKHTIHALTNLRLITFVKGKGKSMRSVDFEDMGPISFDEDADGWGNLSVEIGSYKDSEGKRRVETFEFIGVPDVAKLHRLLQEAQQAR